jgi:hypothetical protein
MYCFCDVLAVDEDEDERRSRTYAAHYIVLTDGALFGVGLEEVDFAEELVLVVFECSDHGGLM